MEATPTPSADLTAAGPSEGARVARDVMFSVEGVVALPSVVKPASCEVAQQATTDLQAVAWERPSARTRARSRHVATRSRVTRRYAPALLRAARVRETIDSKPSNSIAADTGDWF